ncbi:pleckstrin homology domain-containing family F member 2-like isoform X2 [Sycon ciliatum]|uniref:pleckstrin homology domain-containing family F member 2-like isoform X2 n=1 Tax=Sycon ciliatum TaxID=27933 RepID=UPI0031F682BF
MACTYCRKPGKSNSMRSTKCRFVSELRLFFHWATNSEANLRRIMMVESAFGGAGEALQKSGRVLVGEGVLTKICRKKPKPRQFFLFNDVLVYGNIVIDKKKYNKQHVMSLVDVQLASLDDNGELKYGWQIISPHKSFAVYAATATEKAEWMAHINKCINDLRKKSGVEGPSVEGAAVWVPDSNATMCLVCEKTKFSAINRRHHCRKCGTLVCGNCSKHKWLLPQISNKPVRICTRCYAALRSSPESAATATAPGSVPDSPAPVTSKSAAAPAAAASEEAPESSAEDGTGEGYMKPSNGGPDPARLSLLPEPPPPSELLSDEDLPPGDPSRLSQFGISKSEPTAPTDESSEDDNRTTEAVEAKAGSSDEEDDDEEDKRAHPEPSVFFADAPTDKPEE